VDRKRPQLAWGAWAGDLNRDGGLELLVVHGATAGLPELDPPPPGYNDQRDYLLSQEGPGGRFEPVPGQPEVDIGVGEPVHNGRGAYPADFDNDCDTDFLVGGYADGIRVIENNTIAESEAIRFRFNPASEAVAVGAVIELHFSNGTSVRQDVTAGGQPYGHGARVVEIPIGDREPVRASITWMNGVQQRIDLRGQLGCEILLQP